MTVRDRIVGLERVRAGDLAPHPENWRKHPERQRSVLQDMLEEVGIADAVIARRLEDGKLQLIDGHLRSELDPEQILPVLVLDVDEDEARKLLVSIDPLAMMADTAHEQLRALAGQINAETDGLKTLLDQLAGQGDRATDLDEQILPPTKAITKPGDLWILGDTHRVLCGSATEPADLKRLLDGAKASMVFTDPPYGVSYEARSGKFEVIEGDDKRRDELAQLLLGSLRLAVKHTTDDAAFYIWHASSTREDFAFAMKAAGLEERQYLIWAKPGIVLGRSDYRWAHEPCFYAAKAGQTPAWHGGRDQATVWRVAATGDGRRAVALGPGVVITDGEGTELFVGRAPKRKLRHVRLSGDESIAVIPDGQSTVWEVGRDPAAEHPTQKPVELARRAIANSTGPGELVLDPFLGSGSTLIGAYATGRRCAGTELDPRYVDVICTRWQRITGAKPVLERTGRARDFGVDK